MRREIISHLGPPSQTLMSIADQLTTFSQFLVLDAGCGLGRNAMALAARGLSVVCADHDLRRLHTLVRLAPPHITELKGTGATRMGQLFPVLTNLNQSQWPFSQNCFGAIICVHFLDTDLFGACRQSLVTGGYLYIETFGGHGGNYLELPKAGQLHDLLSRHFRLPFYRERAVGPPGCGAVSVKLLGQNA
jgi:SAM-dependent methyltransferase